MIVINRNQTRQIDVRGVKIGGGAPVTVQSMCNTKTWDVEATVGQIEAFKAAGCDIVRIAVPDMASAEAVSESGGERMSLLWQISISTTDLPLNAQSVG